MREINHFFRRILEWTYQLIGKELTDSQWHVWEQFIKFALVGCSNSLICIVVCYLIIWIGGKAYYLLGQTFGYIVAVLNSFYWNSRRVFSDYHGNPKVAFVKMCLCNVVIYVLQIAISFLSVNLLEVSEWIAPILAVLIALPVNFTLNKLFAFR